MESIYEIVLGILIVTAVSFAVTVVLGKLLIPILRALHAGQSIKEIGPTWHMSKQGTPTMGGLMFIAAIGVVTAVKNTTTGTVTEEDSPSTPSVILTAFTVPTITKAANTM